MVAGDGIVRDPKLLKMGESADVFGVGHHCTECRELDFLALQCRDCRKWHCHEHGIRHASRCAQTRGNASDESKKANQSTGKHTKKSKKKKCRADKCKANLNILSMTCPDCSQEFCTKHRMPTDHKCGKNVVVIAAAQRSEKSNLREHNTPASHDCRGATRVEKNVNRLDPQRFYLPIFGRPLSPSISKTERCRAEVQYEAQGSGAGSVIRALQRVIRSR